MTNEEIRAQNKNLYNYKERNNLTNGRLWRQMAVARSKTARKAYKFAKPQQGVSYIDPATADYMAKAMGVRDIKGEGLDINLISPEKRFNLNFAGLNAFNADPFVRRTLKQAYGVPIKPTLYADALTRFKRGSGAVYLDKRSRNADILLAHELGHAKYENDGLQVKAPSTNWHRTIATNPGFAAWDKRTDAESEDFTGAYARATKEMSDQELAASNAAIKYFHENMPWRVPQAKAVLQKMYRTYDPAGWYIPYKTMPSQDALY